MATDAVHTERRHFVEPIRCRVFDVLRHFYADFKGFSHIIFQIYDKSRIKQFVKFLHQRPIVIAFFQKIDGNRREFHRHIGAIYRLKIDVQISVRIRRRGADSGFEIQTETPFYQLFDIVAFSVAVVALGQFIYHLKRRNKVADARRRVIKSKIFLNFQNQIANRRATFEAFPRHINTVERVAVHRFADAFEVVQIFRIAAARTQSAHALTLVH